MLRLRSSAVRGPLCGKSVQHGGSKGRVFHGVAQVRWFYNPRKSSEEWLAVIG
jgi:hypothetical protein